MYAGRLIVSCLTLALVAACNRQSGPTPSHHTTHATPAATVQANTYQGVGTVKSLNPKRPGIEIDHEDIDGLMPGMQMEFPLKESSLLSGLAVNDRVEFTIDNNTGDMTIIAIKKKD